MSVFFSLLPAVAVRCECERARRVAGGAGTTRAQLGRPREEGSCFESGDSVWVPRSAFMSEADCNSCVKRGREVGVAKTVGGEDL